MSSFQSFGRILIITGIIVFVLGLLLTFSDKFPFLGKLPGDVIVKKENFSFYFPIVTSIILSMILSLVFYLISKFRN
ncbi:MAG: DUF2905 domain-containing protein [Bacteroidota bacterium]|nr:DUF2905 domain-containing protein [Bacteroidota bacterium]